MFSFKEEYLRAFLESQERLFDWPVASTLEEADDFLLGCMAEVADGPEEIRECLDGMGMDFSDLADDELLEAAEVFPMPDGKYLVVAS